ncbi:hypothetical protein CDL12_20638 [Handroanthus impetiginosus]|uniref:BHLH domain-containing protein n=1 Tax=Handroanthus impetiginosus TaxID=429701 RepID=A0A2G9GNG1_9LAMI|nr:hypothetical protein CDL12_20638 [Handroanthus impetiginosus]
MELTQHTLLEELILPPKIDNITTWTSFPNELIFPNSIYPFDQIPDFHLPIPTNPSLLELISAPPDQLISTEPSGFVDILTLPAELSSNYDVQAMPVYSNEVENTEFGFVDVNAVNGLDSSFVVETTNTDSTVYVGEKKVNGKISKKGNGLPSKNLMAERRRRKRLNDRLSMLRSIVPKISKMDRTSILGDTIDYMKELLDKIHKLREQGMEEGDLSLIGNYFKELKPNEMLVSNPPKFDVERRNEETRVEVCCTAKPGLLISTLTTMDALGLDIHQCVISCFNDFSLQASCFEAAENRSLVGVEDVKQALFRSAGYGGRCL